MATIIAVHGTYAAGPEEGSYWWQRGSQFEADLRRYVEAESGELTFKPFGWDGLNSVLSRQKAAERLDKVARELDTSGESYCILGQSHGGTIIGQHFYLEPKRQRSLSRWITVGTPFLTFAPYGMLFTRLGRTSQIVYLSLVLCCLVAMLVAMAKVIGQQNFTVFEAVFVIIPLIPFVPYHLYLRWAEKRRLRYLASDKSRAKVTPAFARGMHLWHAADEALSALGNVGRARLTIFSRETVQPVIVTGYLFLLPLLTLAALMALGSHCPSLGKACPTETVQPAALQWLYAGAWFILYRLDDLVREAMALVTEPSFVAKSYWLVMAATGLAAITLYATLCRIVFGLLQMIAAAISAAISRSLNMTTSHRVRELAFGNDDIALTAVACGPTPYGDRNEGRPLPPDLEKLLTDRANTAASESIAKLRNALGTLISVLASTNAENDTSQYLSWRELIHTCYFDVPEIRLLIVYLVAQSPGFRATQALREHPDLPRLERWAAQIGSSVPSST